MTFRIASILSSGIVLPPSNNHADIFFTYTPSRACSKKILSQRTSHAIRKRQRDRSMYQLRTTSAHLGRAYAITPTFRTAQRRDATDDADVKFARENEDHVLHSTTAKSNANSCTAVPSVPSGSSDIKWPSTH